MITFFQISLENFMFDFSSKNYFNLLLFLTLTGALVFIVFVEPCKEDRGPLH